MWNLQSRRMRSAVVAGAVGLAILTPASVAAADSTVSAAPPLAASLRPDTIEPATVDGSAGVQPNAVTYEVNPWGCSSEAQNPHPSGHYPGTVAAVAVHSCTGYFGIDRRISTYPDRQSLEAWLYYQSCFLFICSWSFCGGVCWLISGLYVCVFGVQIRGCHLGLSCGRVIYAIVGI